MNHRPILIALGIFALLACDACSNFPGVQRPGLAAVPPSEVVDFNALYGQNCAGCHGEDGKGGAGIALANPVFLAIADDDVIRRVASNGVPGTPMSAFAQSAGGMLTEKQIDALVSGIRSWAKPNALGETPPPMRGPTRGGYHETGLKPGHLDICVLQMPAGIEHPYHYTDTINLHVIVAGSVYCTWDCATSVAGTVPGLYFG